MSKQGWWLGWYNPSGNPEFELHSPWWISGSTMDDRDIFVGAVWAEDEDEAFQIIRASYDDDPGELERRFCSELGDDTPWSSPENGRFPQGKWMAWDNQGKTCACSEC